MEGLPREEERGKSTCIHWTGKYTCTARHFLDNVTSEREEQLISLKFPTVITSFCCSDNELVAEM